MALSLMFKSVGFPLGLHFDFPNYGGTCAHVVDLNAVDARILDSIQGIRLGAILRNSQLFTGLENY